MSNRLSKGTVVAGRFSQDGPGFPKMGPAVRIVTPGSTAETTTGYSFQSNDVLEGFYVKVTLVTATSGILSLGLLSTATSGFVIALPVGSTGFKSPIVVSTSGDAPKVFFATSYLGPLLGAVYAGTTEGSTGGATAGGAWVPRLYSMDTTTNMTLSYSYNSTAAFAATVYPVFYTLNS